MSKKSIMITGVSTGIGLGTLSYFVKNGFHVYGSVRNSKDASRLKKIYKDNFTPLIFDVTKEAQLKKAVAFLKKDLKNSNLLALVNNAGVAISGPLLHQKVKDFEKQIDINLNGAFRVIKYFAPLCGAEKNNSFTGEFWSGEKSKDLGLVDGIGDMTETIQEKFGKKVKIKNFDKPESWLKRRLSSNLSNDIINISYELESRYLWNKYGL